jgi:hypothetical protein
MSELNLIYAGRETPELVKELSNDWIINGPIRAAAHLAGVWWTLSPKSFKREALTSFSMDGKNVFGPMALEHDWVKWACESHENYGWLYYYAVDMCEEYERRFGFKPYILTMLSALEGMPDEVPEGEWSEPAFAKLVTHV